MLSQSDFPIEEALELLTRHDLEVTLLVPTPNGMEKSIFDATADLREYLRDRDYHDYASQGQGESAKITREAFFVLPTSLVSTQVSLYRPTTKKGDPRIWLGRATRAQAGPGNLLALLVIGGVLYILNMSDSGVRQSLGSPRSPLVKILGVAGHDENPAVSELLDKLREVCARGFIKTLRPGATGIGMTLETVLGIAANSSQFPDFKGIEIKAKRGGKGDSRTTLFSQVPDWSLSPVGSSMGLLQRRGYTRDGRLQLYHELDARQPNSIGLFLLVDEARDWLKQSQLDKVTGSTTHDVTWQMQKLRDRLAQKHRETFWVHARCQGKGANEEFEYHTVEHTKGPKVRNLEALIEAGVISLDYTLSQLSATRARDHGYLFKIHSSNLGALFPPSRRYALDGSVDGRAKGQDRLACASFKRVVEPGGSPLPLAVQSSLDLPEGGSRGPIAANYRGRCCRFLRSILRSLSRLGKPGGGAKH